MNLFLELERNLLEYWKENQVQNSNSEGQTVSFDSQRNKAINARESETKRIIKFQSAVIEEQTTGNQHVIGFSDSTLGIQEDPHQTTRDEQVCRGSTPKPTGHSIGPHLESCKVLNDKHLGSGTLWKVRPAD